MDNIIMLFVVFIATLLTRFLPFIIFSKEKIPHSLLILGKILPPAMIGMLIVYCLKDTAPFVPPYGLNELCGVCITALLYVLTKLGVLAVIGGTLGYMFLLQSHLLESLL